MIAVLSFFTEYRTTFTFGLIYGLFALATYVSLSTGVLSVAAATFGAIGGYMYAALQRDHDVSLVVGLILGMAAGAVAAFLLSLVVLRLVTHYMAMATIALVLITRVFILNLSSVTGGANGTGLVRQANLLWILGIVVICLWATWRFSTSRFGLAATAVREDPAVASTLGVNPRHVQRVGLLMSGAIGGIAGVLLADQLQFIGPNTYYIDLAFVMLAAVVLGGAFHWLGAMVGAMVFRFLPEILQDYVGHSHEIANGILLVIIMIYLPRGFVDSSRRKRRERPIWRRGPDPGPGATGGPSGERPEAVTS